MSGQVDCAVAADTNSTTDDATLVLACSSTVGRLLCLPEPRPRNPPKAPLGLCAATWLGPVAPTSATTVGEPDRVQVDELSFL
jgi:hypothetical protein